jgi:hypothetical protein
MWPLGRVYRIYRLSQISCVLPVWAVRHDKKSFSPLENVTVKENRNTGIEGEAVKKEMRERGEGEEVKEMRERGEGEEV